MTEMDDCTYNEDFSDKLLVVDNVEAFRRLGVRYLHMFVATRFFSTDLLPHDIIVQVSEALIVNERADKAMVGCMFCCRFRDR